MTSRYGHLVAAFERRANRSQDSLVADRFHSLKRWSGVQSMVLILLSLGLIAAFVSYLGQFVEGFSSISDLLGRLAAYAGYFTGFFTVAYLFLTRLLSQIEADILSLLLLEHKTLNREQIAQS